MEFLRAKGKLFTSVTFYLSLSVLLFQPTHALAPEGTIKRTTKQQILASIQPHSDQQNSQPILTSPSGNYGMYFIRRGTTPGAGGYGGDFCYVQVQATGSGRSLWESECTPMSSANTCSLVFSDQGLEVFDGSRSAWDTGVDADDPLETLELVNEGDMRIRDQTGELVWRASDDPRANQECGSPGAPGLASALPPFAAPIDGGSAQPFGQPAPDGSQQQVGFQQHPLGFQQQQEPLGYRQQQQNGFGQPLVDDTPFDSGNSLLVVSLSQLVLLAVLLSLAGYGLLF